MSNARDGKDPRPFMRAAYERLRDVARQMTAATAGKVNPVDVVSTFLVVGVDEMSQLLLRKYRREPPPWIVEYCTRHFGSSGEATRAA